MPYTQGRFEVSLVSSREEYEHVKSLQTDERTRVQTDRRFSYSLIKKNAVLPAYEIWISLRINNVNYNVDRSKDIYSSFQKISTCIDNLIKLNFMELLRYKVA